MFFWKGVQKPSRQNVDSPDCRLQGVQKTECLTGFFFLLEAALFPVRLTQPSLTAASSSEPLLSEWRRNLR